MSLCAAYLHVVKAVQQARDRALARAGRTDDREAGAGRHAERNVAAKRGGFGERFIVVRRVNKRA